MAEPTHRELIEGGMNPEEARKYLLEQSKPRPMIQRKNNIHISPNIVNVKNKDDLITVDLRTMQIRYLKEPEKRGPIEFMSLSRDDVAGYDYLWKNDKRLFLKTLQEDVASFMGIKIELKDLKILDRLLGGR